MSNWIEPFLKLYDSLQHIHAANPDIYHTVVLSANKSRSELEGCLGWLEPALCGRKLIREIPATTKGDGYHAHLYFSEDLRGLSQLQQNLRGIDEWFDRLPPGLVPGFDVPRAPNQCDRDLVKWTSLVYYLANAADAPYFDAQLEFQHDVSQIGFLPWSECPQPPGCGPLPWLIHQGISADQIERGMKRFREQGERFPDIVDAYLSRDFIESSTAAIDILVYKLNSERRRRKNEVGDTQDSSKSKSRKYSKTKAAIGRLALSLQSWHALNRPCLTWSEIAVMAGIRTREGKEANSTVSRLMKAIFGSDPKKRYRNLVSATDGGRELRRVVEKAIEAFEDDYLESIQNP